MPRKFRVAKQRRGDAVRVSPALFLWLLWRDWEAAMSAAENDDDARTCYLHDDAVHWHAIEAAALVEWTACFPGTRPESWWDWSAPSYRQVIGRFTSVGIGCHPTGVPFVQPSDVTDLPMIETTPALLDRTRLWLPGERARVPAVAFEAEPFSWTLTVGPHRLAEGACEE